MGTGRTPGISLRMAKLAGGLEDNGEVRPFRPAPISTTLPPNFETLAASPLHDRVGARKRAAEGVVVLARHGPVRNIPGHAGRSKLHRFLKLAQTVELFLGCAFVLFRGVGDILFGVPDLLVQRLGVELLEGDRRLGKQDQPVLACVR